MPRVSSRPAPRPIPSAGSAFLSFGFLLSLLLPLAHAGGQEPSERIQEFVRSASGFELMGQVHEGSLGTEGAMEIGVTLFEGFDYIMVAYSEEACRNLDLSLFGPSAEEVRADRLPDAQPMLTLTGEASGHHYLQVDMVDCSQDVCDVAVGILVSTSEPGVPPGEDMASRLALFSTELRSLGFTELEDEKRGFLGTDQAVDIPLTLEEGREYRMAGVCDVDCFDLDLALLDPEGREVRSDVLEDAVPLLNYVPEASGEHRLHVIMVACGIEPCAFRIATYVRGEDEGTAATTFSGELVFQETYRGALERGDQWLSGAYLDTYTVEARPGQRIIVDLRSEDFDTLLRLAKPDGSMEENDDFAYDRSHSRIEILALEEGTYTVQATSFSEFATGEYVLQLAVVE